jgi:Uma2 family endonuclease
MATIEAQALPVEQHFVLSGIDWPTYVVFSDQLGERRVRVTYDRGVMELMTVSHEHEWSKTLLARFVEVLTEEADIDIASGGSMTWRREDLERGIEPDECYWVAHEPDIRGRMHIDLENDPPPDLMLEIEISRSFLDRLAICAAMRVPEVWRWDGESLRISILGHDGRYQESERSLAFPFLPIRDVERFLKMAGTMSETKLVRAFRTWVREQIARGWAS